MKDTMLEDKTQVEELKAKLWRLFPVLKAEPISSDEYQFTLLLLSAFNEGYIDTYMSWQEAFTDFSSGIKDRILSNVYDYASHFIISGIPIFTVFESTLKNLSVRGFRDIVEIFANLDKDVLKENFPEIFDSLLYRISEAQGKAGGELAQSVELTRLICSLAELPSDASIFNPFAGLASFGVGFPLNQKYFGQEINNKVWALGILRLSAHKSSDLDLFKWEDSISRWPNSDQKFDLIVSHPPFGLRLGRDRTGYFSNATTAEQFLIEKGVESINWKGKLIVLLSSGILFRGGGDGRLRQQLIERDLIDIIIALPSGILSYSGIPLVILVISQQKEFPGKVRFVDASNFVRVEKRRKVLLDELLSNVIKSSDGDSDVIRFIDNELIIDRDFNLNVPRYFQKEYEGTFLSNILDPLRGNFPSVANAKKVVRIKDLKEDQIQYFLDLSALEESDNIRADFRLINESCLLVATRWRTLKPTFFEFNGESILVTGDIAAFKVKREDINLSYLIHELHADYVQDQLNSYRSGTAIPYVRRDDLLKIKIVKPSVEEQQAKVEGYREVSSDIALLQQKIEALVDDNRRNKFEEFASLKHTLGRPRQNILDWSDNLIHFLNGKAVDIVHLNKSFAEFYDIDIISALLEIKRDINFMSEVLEKGEKGLVLSDYPKMLVTLTEMNGIINGISSNGFNFKLVKIPIKGESLRNRGIDCNPTLFKTLIDNILTNANKHGFSYKEVANEVVIKLSELEGYLVMDIRNNGKQFPKNFDKDKFVNKYSTANPEIGSGLGGYDINRIAEYFNNPKWELILGDDPIYPVQFRFQFPIKLAN